MIYWALALLILGMIFAIVEIVIPGFGFFGITGIVCFMLSGIFTIFYVPYGLYIVIIEAIILIVSGYLIFEYVKSKNVKGTLILDESLAEDKKADYSFFVGREGISKSSLKPFGKADFNGDIIEVCADAFIEKGQKIKAVRFYDGKLYVKSIT